MTERPNFLFFITDQHRADWLGCAGHPVVKTPNIDAIAAEGAMFEDFHVASPVCMPNRAALMTGRMPSVNSVRFNGAPLPKTENTFVDVLAASGYDTALIGKSHLQPFTPDPSMRLRPATGPIEEAWRPDEADYFQEHPSRYQGDQRGFEDPYYGFQHVDMVTGHGDKCGGHYRQWFRQQRADWKDLHDPANEIPHNYTCPQAYRTPVPEDLYPTTFIAERAIDWIGARGDDPFFAFVSFPDPHHPFNPPGKYWDMYSPDDFDIPLPYDAHQNPTPTMQAMTEGFERGEGPLTPQTAFRASDQQVREAMALTAGMITMIDDQVGRVIAALKAAGKYENTVIVFTSDHGDYLGDFNMLLKGTIQRPAVTRVPMIWSDPRGRTASRTAAMAQTIDLPASILDRAGIRPYIGMQGRSFLGAMSGGEHRDEVFIEYNDGMPRLGFTEAARVRTLRDRNWRLTIYRDEPWGELYDLANDPDETRNLWDAPEAAEAKADMTLRLVHALAHQMDDSPMPERLA